MTDAHRAEVQAILTVAADIEAQRQAARAAHHVDHELRLSDELRRLWMRWASLEDAA